MNANYYAHTQGCPYSCNYEPPVNGSLSVGDGLYTMSLLLIIYFVWKFKRR